MVDFSFSSEEQKKAEKWIREKKVKRLDFSEGTYQIEIKETGKKESFWPFLQLNDVGTVLDSFCTCSSSPSRPCMHLITAYLKIFNHQDRPLHVRFRNSFWNQLGLLGANRYGYDVSCLRKEPKKIYSAFSTSGKKSFFLQPLNKESEQHLQEILFNRPLQTEETSIKFSNLASEELLLWKEGRPSQHLRYELSFWSDLAKWWMLLQEDNQDYQIEYKEGEDNLLPQWISVRLQQILFGFYIAQAQWLPLIPSLSTVDSPLKVFENPEGDLKEIIYDPFLKTLTLEWSLKTSLPTQEQGVSINGWSYLPKRGFFSNQRNPLLEESIVSEQRIPSFLKHHYPLFQKYLRSFPVHSGAIPPRYLLFFDSNGALHLPPPNVSI
jgi:hypothetical protein